MDRRSDTLLTLVCCVFAAGALAPAASEELGMSYIPGSRSIGDLGETTALDGYQPHSYGLLGPVAGYAGAGRSAPLDDSAERIRLALRRFLSHPVANSIQSPGGASQLARGLQTPEISERRIQTRSAVPASSKQETWFESALDSAKFNREAESRLEAALAAASPASERSVSGSSGHKTIRNIQPVFMRLPPRFGKRTC